MLSNVRRRLPAYSTRRFSNVYIAAYTLTRRFAEQEDRKKALFYGEIARGAAQEPADAPSPRLMQLYSVTPGASGASFSRH